jgi:hypothetical protein
VKPAHSETRPRSWLIRPLLLVAIAAALVAAVSTTLSFARGLGTDFQRSDDPSLEGNLWHALGQLGQTRRKLERTKARLEGAHDQVRRLEMELGHTARLSARRARLLGKIRGATGGELPLTDDPCDLNVALAAARGLRLPEAYAIHCPGPGLDWNGASHWGVTCPYAECPEGEGPYVSISNPTYYVVAHELCHAVFGYGGGPADEAMADSCAAAHGASLATSPYR